MSEADLLAEVVRLSGELAVIKAMTVEELLMRATSGQLRVIRADIDALLAKERQGIDDSVPES